MNIVFWILAVIFSISIISSFIYFGSSKSALKRKSDFIEKDDSHIYLIVAATGKKRDMVDTLSHFFEISRFMKVITFVVTSNEKSETLNNYDIASKIVTNKRMESNILIIPYPNNDDSVAAYFNYAINYIKQYDKSDFIVGLYEEDVNLSSAEVGFVRENINENTIIKEYSVYKELTKNKLLNGFIMANNRKVVIDEIGRNYYNTKKRQSTSAYLSLTGTSLGTSGLFCKFSTLQKIGFIPEDEKWEDKFLGMITNYLKIKIETMPYIITRKTPSKVSDIAPSIKNEFMSLLKGGRYYNKLVNKISNNRYDRSFDIKSSFDYRTISHISYNLMYRGLRYFLSFPVGFLLFVISGISAYGFNGFAISLLLYFFYSIMFDYLITNYLGRNTDIKYKYGLNYFPFLTNAFKTLLCLGGDTNGKK